MASTNCILPGFVFSVFIVLLSFPSFVSSNHEHVLSSCKFDAIYQLGDSIADTGNYVQQNPSAAFARLPYGETLEKPTGRCSDGLLMIDYIAMSAGIPYLDAYLNKDGVFDHGVNFAVAGATAMPVISRCLSKQLDWMFSYFNATCHVDKDCFNKNGRALFMVGEIGGNDYNYPFFRRKTLDEVKLMVPGVVQAIKHAAKTVIAYGATRLVVPGNFPIGCFPVYLTLFQTDDTTAYDELHCLIELNKFSIYHNNLLREAIDELKEEHPGVIVVYGDYYNAFLWLLSKADMLGFDPKSLQKACCGTGGDCNFDLSSMCGDPKVTICDNPEERISWDGIHLTQRAYKLMATWLIRDIYPKLQCEYIASYSSSV
ncbi:hypothetical protein like AT5G03980 [Hibiscus trionum]|uniref:Acetylajmalan esterase-like n=1 Tax=Hibiscus trionum TaxID=183268 RepID=A0A9W7JC49_HIBTR|nr:hypothetical protein like AT5G03980 [Hibiscus trionum]